NAVHPRSPRIEIFMMARIPLDVGTYATFLQAQYYCRIGSSFNPLHNSRRKLMANQVNWFEIPVSDLDRAQKYYRNVFAYEFDVTEGARATLAMFSGDASATGATGALVDGPGNTPAQTGTFVYFACADLINEMKKIAPTGGKVLMPTTAIGQRGFIAQFIDR